MLILGGAYLIYKNVMANQEAENAKTTLNTIISKIEILAEPKGKFTIQGFQKSNTWFLLSWNKNDPTNTKPEKCFLNSCLCLCKSQHDDIQSDNWKENCQTQGQGFCTEIKDKDIFVNNLFAYSELRPKDTFYSKNKLHPQMIYLRPNLMEIHIEKNASTINLTYYTDEYLTQNQK